jgi:hypothetical protein
MGSVRAATTMRIRIDGILIAARVMSAALLAASLAGQVSAAPVLNAANGHYYEAIVFGDERDYLVWDAARVAAEARVFNGRAGYLATVTSQAENDFLVASFASARPARGELWVGGSDEPVDGDWRWVVGPEAGTLFWTGGPAGAATLFADWAAGEPNNAFGPAGESRLGWSELGWNDLPASGAGSVKPGYIVEFSAVPELRVFALFGLGLLGLGLTGWHKKAQQLV